jgi:hypothetical protein
MHRKTVMGREAVLGVGVSGERGHGRSGHVSAVRVWSTDGQWIS